MNEFSPQAKKEMKALKELHGRDWASTATPESLNSGAIWGKSGTDGDNIIYHLGNPESEIQKYLGGNGKRGYRIMLEAPDGGGYGYKTHNTFQEARQDRSSYIQNLLDDFQQ